MMRWKRLLLMIVVLFVFSAVSVWASDAYQWYKGKTTEVTLNGQKLQSDGLLVKFSKENKTMLPLREIAEKLQAVVKWDEKTQSVHLYKPNVHLLLATMNRDNSYGVFGKVNQGDHFNFIVFTQIDNIQNQLDAIKIEITDPSGEVVYSHEHQLHTLEDPNWLRAPVKLEFKQEGNYKVSAYMRMQADDPYSLVSEKVFPSI